jgi:YVTN family beta-propeller protein
MRLFITLSGGRGMKKYIFLFSILIISLLFTPVHSDPKKGYGSLAVDITSNRLLASAEDSTGVEIIDLKTGELINLVFPDKEIRALVIDAQRKIIAAIDEDRFLHLASTKTFEIYLSVPIKGKPTSLAMDSELGLIILTAEEGKVIAVDLDTSTVIAEIDVADKPESVAIDPQLHIAVIIHHTWGEEDNKGGYEEKGRDNITLIDLQTMLVIKTLQGGKNPVNAAVNPEKHEAAVANEESNDVTIIDLITLAIKGNIAVGKHPKSLSYNECIDTLSIIGGEDKGWMQVIGMDTWNIEASYPLNGKLADIKVHSFLNKAALAGKEGLSIIDLPNPVPYLMSITPDKVLRGEKSFSFNLIGHGFLAMTDTFLNGGKTNTTFLGCTSIRGDVPEKYLEKTGDIEIRAENPSPNGGISNPLYLWVENPLPAISVLDPLEIMAGAQGFPLAVYGSGFFDDSTIYINGISRPFALSGQTKMQIPLRAEDLEFGRSLEITVSNPPPGGGSSMPVTFAVLNPFPELTSINPTSTIAGRPDFILALSGNNFIKTATVSFNNMQLPIKYVNKTSIETTIPWDAVKTPGNIPVKVINPAPGGGETLPLSFVVKPPLEIKIASPVDGTAINKAKIMVKGTVKSDTKDIGVKVNGIIAEITGNDWIADNVPLKVGQNTITATVTDFYGNADTNEVTVVTNDAIEHIKLTANITSGLPPVSTYFYVSANVPYSITGYQMDYEGDGVIDSEGTNFETLSHEFTSEGTFYPTITVTDGQGNIYSDTIAIIMLNKGEIDALLKGKWEGINEKLKNHDIEGALQYFDERSQQRYRNIFLAIKDKLPTILSTFTQFNIVDVYDNIAEYEIVANEGGVLYSYPSLIIRDGKGVWKFKNY